MRRGCLDCRLIEPAPDTYVGGRCQRCREARGVTGQKIGRPRTRIELEATCEVCFVRFKWLSRDSRLRTACSRKCHLVTVRKKRGKLPGADVLRELYVKQNLSTPKIAEMFRTNARTVNSALHRYGIPMRRRTRVLTCQWPEGCTNRVKKLRHPINGSWYGTMCAIHREKHRRELSIAYRKADPIVDGAADILKELAR
jgi:hypothetical protein